MRFSSLLITREVEETNLLKDFCEQNEIRLFSKSFIALKALKSVEKVNTEVVFIGSRNAFDFYLLNQEHDPRIEIACIGEATRKYIESLAYQVSFCGSESGNPEKVSLQLNTWLAGKSICFIRSTESTGRIEKHITSQVHDLSNFIKHALFQLFLMRRLMFWFLLVRST